MPELIPATVTGSRARSAVRRIVGTDRLLQLGLVLLLALGVWRVVEPFLPAILFALAIASCSWPLHARIRRAVSGREALASILACVLVTICVLAPATLLVLGIADGAQSLLGFLGKGTAPALPPALRELPLIGPELGRAWDALGADPQTLRSLLAHAAAPARDVAVVSGQALANATLQGGISALLLYFFFRNGERLAGVLRAGLERLCGPLATELVDVARNSVTGVMFGELGAGLAQGAVATIGFAIAGVPNPFLLGAMTFVVSIVPIGPPLIWFGATLWLIQQGEGGWALFMFLYGMFVISTIDNVLKPLLISRASRLPFVIALVGVFGGMLGFGMVGVFLGPTLLALAADVTVHWMDRGPAKPAPVPAGGTPPAEMALP